ncbi:UNVERIFIED_CONTAM: hypothetical protein Slati_2365800 [Sesamum latifolium]|uniref:Uncharacterized protein n=1 Tax=Sesamum latifolium TaxID=2727402 RepID=A0AAW2WBJ2_9LAMI
MTRTFLTCGSTTRSFGPALSRRYRGLSRRFYGQPSMLWKYDMTTLTTGGHSSVSEPTPASQSPPMDTNTGSINCRAQHIICWVVDCPPSVIASPTHPPYHHHTNFAYVH